MASKPATPKSPAKAAAKPAAKPKLVAGADVAPPEGEVGEAAPKGAAGLKLKDLVERVVEASGAKKKDAKAVVEATLAEIGRALAVGEALNLPALGKLRVVRAGTEGGGAMTLKLRKPGAPAAGGKAKGKSAKDTLAEGDE